MSRIDLARIDLNLLVVFEVLMQERSVTRAAERLARTQSAISHALARLREQLNDPLLVKGAGRMVPSPYALELFEQVRPLLRQIERVLGPREAFDPARSSRLFRLALPDLGPSLFPRVLARVRAQAPQVAIEWVAPRDSLLLEVADGQIDVALVPQALKRPDGVAMFPVGALRWACFGRRSHPAFAAWGRKAWAQWPHVVVGVGDRLRSPVNDAAARAGLRRVVAARVPHFSAVPPLLAGTDLLATLPAVVMADAVARFDLASVPAPFRIDALPHALVCSARMTHDRAVGWMRAALAAVVGELIASSAPQGPVRGPRRR
jgi:DNA-binding transcriptional LysR family regulator